MPAPKPTKTPRWAQLVAWAQNTYYATGDRVLANGNIYTCTSPGTSAGAGGGPAGNGGAIADGGVTWAFSAVSASAWAVATPYALGARVTNAGNLYVCIQVGNSAGAGPGPTATNVNGVNAIPDNSVVWMYLSAATAIVTEPSEAQKDVGWTPGQKPPAQYFDWWMFIVYTWILYLRDLADQVWTWTAAHTFNKGITVNNDPGFDAGTFNGSGAGKAINGIADTGIGIEGSSNANIGVQGIGSPGVQGYALVGSGARGVTGQGDGSGAGVKGFGDPAGTGPGVDGTGGAGPGAGGLGGPGGLFVGGPGRPGVYATGGSFFAGGENCGLHVDGPTDGIHAKPSGANGSALIAVAKGNGTGVDSTGGVVGPAYIGRAFGTNDFPIFEGLDKAGNLRTVIDHNGYRFGRVSTWEEVWRFVETVNAVGPSAKYNDFSFNLIGTGTGRRLAPGVSDPTATMYKVDNDGLADGDRSFWVSEQIVIAGVDASIALEFEMIAGAIGANQQIFAGLINEPNGDPSLATSGAWIQSGAQWQAFAKSTGGGASGGLNMGVGIALGARIRVRIELHGVNSPYGAAGNGLARFYINGGGAFGPQQTSIILADGPLRFFVGCRRNGAGGAAAANVIVGHARMQWNRYMSPDFV